jgi:lysophospholipase L1-like esterase
MALNSIVAACLMACSRPPGTDRNGPVVFLGDSLTYFLDVVSVAPDAVNYGSPGYTTTDLLRTIEQYPELDNARLVVLTIGTNDVNLGLEHGIELRMTQIASSIKSPMVWNALPQSTMGDVRPVNEIIRRQCSKKPRCTYLETRFQASDFKDGVHLSQSGNARWAEAMRSVVPSATASMGQQR